MTRQLVALISTEGKTPEQVAAEMMGAVQKFERARDAAGSADGRAANRVGTDGPDDRADGESPPA